MLAQKLSLGTAQLGMPYGIAGSDRPLRRDEADAILASALDLGITALDTAPAYGLAEQRIGEFLAGRGLQEVFEVSTKLAALDQVPNVEIGRHVESSVLGSLRRMKLDRVAVYLVHNVGDLVRHGNALVDALCEQRYAGRIGRLGVSVYAPEDLRVLDQYTDFSVVQHPFNLLDHRFLRDASAIELRRRGLRMHVRSVLLQGLLTMDPNLLPSHLTHARKPLSSLRRVLAGYALEPLDAALPFALRFGAERVVIGFDSPAQLVAAAESLSIELPDALCEELSHQFADCTADVVDPRNWMSS